MSTNILENYFLNCEIYGLLLKTNINDQKETKAINMQTYKRGKLSNTENKWLSINRSINLNGAALQWWLCRHLKHWGRNIFLARRVAKRSPVIPVCEKLPVFSWCLSRDVPSHAVLHWRAHDYNSKNKNKNKLIFQAGGSGKVRMWVWGSPNSVYEPSEVQFTPELCMY